MWALLSTRLRTWLLLAVALPTARRAVGYAARRSERSDPSSRGSRVLRRADGLLSRTAARRRR
jgi:hypothetical protein